MFWCICGGGGLGLMTILGVFVLAENLGTVLEVFVSILIVALIIGCLYQLALRHRPTLSPNERWTWN